MRALFGRGFTTGRSTVQIDYIFADTQTQAAAWQLAAVIAVQTLETLKELLCALSDKTTNV